MNHYRPLNRVYANLFVFAAQLLLVFSAASSAQDVKGSLQLEDVFEFEFASDPQISPDGRSIVYVRNYYDIMTDRRRSDLWVVGEGLSNQPFLPDAQYSDPFSPRWSPDGKKLAFVTSDASGRSQIFCYWADTGKIGRLTNLTQSPSGVAWSPDGSKIAFFMRVPDSTKPIAKLPKQPEGAKWAEGAKVIDRLVYRADGRGFLPYGYSHLFVLSADGGTPRQMTSGDFDHGGGIAWGDDSRSIVISSNRNPNRDDEPRNSELYRVSMENGKIEALTDRFGPDTNPEAGPDGSIAYLGFDDKLLGYQNTEIYLRAKDGSTKILTSGLDRSAGSPTWNPGTKTWNFTYSDRGNSKVASIDGSGRVKVLAENYGSNSNGRPYGGSGPVSVSRNGTIAFTVTGPARPGDVAIVTPEGETRILTELNADLLSARRLGEVKEIVYKSSHDGIEIQGWYITPPDFDPSRKYPLILEIHGGPFADYGDRFTAELQLMAAKGYVVLYTNPRGSTSYGEEFANFIHHNYPGNDYDDLISGVDAMIEKGFVDQNRLFVTGGSGGGVLSAWIVGKTDRFRAAVVAKPVINWYSFVLNSDNTNFYYKYWFPGFPWDDPEPYLRRSPLSLVGNVKTPTMLLTGEADLRTPISESEQFYTALKLRKIDSVMVRIPGASHGIAARPSHLMAKVAHILAWFDKYGGAEDRERIP
ncbi:MAG: S9 family peptidase [Acidobacteria bacterium]|nr:MAG: S9 family peptidase [Acidobacteriota bacterium]REK02001.1 MAG: S9 family peptidase [Acidobacteriota bacterium]REK14959.1 MAG: S9 family peptidase [Acidobacteriota bacterium]REK45673.1 MAG: S9 family peptidase [Acidobacteriota bacterium]